MSFQFNLHIKTLLLFLLLIIHDYYYYLSSSTSSSSSPEVFNLFIEFSTIKFQPITIFFLWSTLLSTTHFDSQLSTIYSPPKLLRVLKSWLKWSTMCPHQMCNTVFEYWILPFKHFIYTIKRLLKHIIMRLLAKRKWTKWTKGFC